MLMMWDIERGKHVAQFLGHTEGSPFHHVSICWNSFNHQIQCIYVCDQFIRSAGGSAIERAVTLTILSHCVS